MLRSTAARAGIAALALTLACADGDGPTLPPAAPFDLVVSRVEEGAHVQLRWNHPGGLVEAYALELSIDGGPWLASGPVDAPLFGATVSFGGQIPEATELRFRLYAIANGLRSPASNEARWVAPVHPPVIDLEHVRSDAGAETVTVAWLPTALARDAVEIERVMVDRHGAEGAPALLTVAGDAITFQDTGVPGWVDAATPRYRVRNVVRGIRSDAAEYVGTRGYPRAPEAGAVTAVDGRWIVTWTNRSEIATAVRVENAIPAPAVLAPDATRHEEPTHGLVGTRGFRVTVVADTGTRTVEAFGFAVPPEVEARFDVRLAFLPPGEELGGSPADGWVTRDAGAVRPDGGTPWPTSGQYGPTPVRSGARVDFPMRRLDGTVLVGAVWDGSAWTEEEAGPLLEGGGPLLAGRGGALLRVLSPRHDGTALRLFTRDASGWSFEDAPACAEVPSFHLGATDVAVGPDGAVAVVHGCGGWGTDPAATPCGLLERDASGWACTRGPETLSTTWRTGVVLRGAGRAALVGTYERVSPFADEVYVLEREGGVWGAPVRTGVYVADRDPAALAASPDGGRIAALFGDDLVLGGAGTWATVATFPGADAIRRIGFTPEGKAWFAAGHGLPGGAGLAPWIVAIER